MRVADALKARAGKIEDRFERDLIAFTKNIIRQCGLVSDQDLDLARKARIDDSLTLEIVAVIALNMLTNYASRLADTEIGSPFVQIEL